MQHHVWRIETARLRRLVLEPALKWPKLLVLDLNGLLVWRTPLQPRPGQTDGLVGACYQHQPDVVTKRFCIWRRPEAASFLEYVLSHFHVGIWSTAQRPNVDDILQALFTTAQREQLAFIMDQRDCTKVAGEWAPGSRHKPLMFKDLNRIWRRFDGFYHIDNTLLVDDDPYKAKHNPAHTSVHPPPWRDPDKQSADKFLAEKGVFRVFLEALRRYDGSVRTFVANQSFFDGSEMNPGADAAKKDDGVDAKQDLHGHRARAVSFSSSHPPEERMNRWDAVSDTAASRSDVVSPNGSFTNARSNLERKEVHPSAGQNFMDTKVVATTRLMSVQREMTSLSDRMTHLDISENGDGPLADEQLSSPRIRTNDAGDSKPSASVAAGENLRPSHT